MQFQHSAEVITIREPAIFSYLLYRPVAVSKLLTGFIEAEVLQNSHWRHVNVLIEQVVQISDTQTRCRSNLIRGEFPSEIFVHEIHSSLNPYIHPSFVPDPGRKLL